MTYRSVVAVKDVSFSIDQGDFLVIVGENGSGKSTLMKGILRLEPLHSGTITYPGIEKNKIGYLPQYLTIQRDFPASVQEVVLSGALNQLHSGFFYTSEMKKRARNIMELLDIASLENTSFRHLSGGQRQRVLLARALCSSNQLLFLDEPVASLDVNITRSLFDLLGELNQNHNLTVVLITHDVSDIIAQSTKILRLHTTLDFYGTPQEYLHTYRRID